MPDPILTLAETKAFIRVDHAEDDTLIAGLILAATETALAHADGLAVNATVPESVRTSALLLVGHWYDHRESVNVGNITSEVPMGSTWLANRFRKWDV